MIGDPETCARHTTLRPVNACKSGGDSERLSKLAYDRTFTRRSEGNPTIAEPQASDDAIDGQLRIPTVLEIQVLVAAVGAISDRLWPFFHSLE